MNHRLPGPDKASEKGGGETEKVRMRFATFANVVLNYILLQSGIIIELQYWTIFNIEGIIFYSKKKIYMIFGWFLSGLQVILGKRL